MTRIHRPEQGVRFIDANGLRFAYFEWGTGPLVLLFHGFPDTAHVWDEIGPAIARAGYRVVAPFQRGYAPTAMPPKDTDWRTLSADVLALISAFGETKARIVGHDWGAEGVLHAAALAPDRVERLVTVAIPHRAALPVRPSLVWGIRHFVTLTLPGAEGRFARDDYAETDVLCRRWSPTWQFGAAELEPVKNAFAAPGCLHAALGYYRAASFLTPGLLKKPLPVPTLSIAGLDDPMVPLKIYEEARRFYAGRYEVAAIPGGHFCLREAPGEFCKAVIPFLA